MSQKNSPAKIIAIIFIIAAVLAITNPSQEKHIENIKQALRDQTAGKGLAGDINAEVGFTDMIVDITSFRYKNYIICSTLNRKGSIVSFGILGFVFTGDLQY